MAPVPANTLKLALLTCAVALSVAPSAEAAGTSMAQWKAYARARMTPVFGWRDDSAAATAPSVLDATRRRIAEQTASGAGIDWFNLSRFELRISAAGASESGIGDREWVQRANGLSSELTQATWIHSLGAGSDLGLTAIVANQRYATQGFGTGPWQSALVIPHTQGEGLAESVDGTGVRLSLDQQLDEVVTASVTLQSRIEMDAFKAFRGVNSDPGDFDIPGFVGTAVSFAVAPRASLALDVQRVFYSEVSTFSNALLPTRFLSLLGDGSSPEFAWRDLTVVGVEARLRDDARGQWSVRYSTQQQPRPTSAVLDHALSERYSDTNFSLGYQRDVGRIGSLQFAAAYSPVSYFFGAIPFTQRQLDGGRQIEFEARLTLPF